MKKLLVTLLAVICIVGITSFAFAQISISVNATATSGTDLGKATLLKCKGYSYDSTKSPWDQCTTVSKDVTTVSLAFGNLVHDLKSKTGTVTGDAGCFYAEDFFIIYLYPNAWGGKGYDIKQTAATFSSAISKAVTRAAVYAAGDQYEGETQKAMTSEEVTNNPHINKSYLATDLTNNRIFKSKKARVVRAEYGIPPYPGTGDTRPTGWEAISKETLAGTYSGSVTLTLTAW